MAIFESATRVPLLIRAPWLPKSAGAVSTAVVELVSLYRTLAELAGIGEVETSVQGHSFASVLANGGEYDGLALAPRADPGGQGGPVGYALSQMTRCAKANASATAALGYDPCAKTPGAAKGYTCRMVILSRSAVLPPR